MTLNTLSTQLADIVASASDAVLSVQSGRHGGSGIAWSTDGQVLTAAHLLRRRRAVQVTLPDGTSHEAEVVGVDWQSDLALLKIDATLTPPTWSDGEGLAVGNLAVTVGRSSRGPRATLGMISALGGPWRTPSGGEVDRFIDVDASLPSTSSGGLLLDVDGGALGMTTHALTRRGATLPVSALRTLVARLANGDLKRGYLGVGVQSVELSAEAAGQEHGVLINSVSADSAAAVAGLMVGDVLLSIAGHPLSDPAALHAALAGRVGDATEVRYLRGGVVQTGTVTPGERKRHRRCG
ncbi:MAG: S1-C subfamily serine protease [Myxococcota bacterium]|jgi:S1-C subfamily serine protease